MLLALFTESSIRLETACDADPGITFSEATSDFLHFKEFDGIMGNIDARSNA